MMNYTTYHVHWSDEDQEFVATCDEFPSLSWLAPSREEALKGLDDLVRTEMMPLSDGWRRSLVQAWDLGYRAAQKDQARGVGPYPYSPESPTMNPYS